MLYIWHEFKSSLKWNKMKVSLLFVNFNCFDLVFFFIYLFNSLLRIKKTNCNCSCCIFISQWVQLLFIILINIKQHVSTTTKTKCNLFKGDTTYKKKDSLIKNSKWYDKIKKNWYLYIYEKKIK